MSRMTMEFQRQIDALRKQPASVPPSLKAERTAKHRLKVKTIAQVRAEVFELDPACICGRCRPSSTDVMHEIVYRSKTRGRPPGQRFNTKICVRLSDACHKAHHDKKLTIVCEDPARGANGPIRLTWKKTGREVVYQRKRV